VDTEPGSGRRRQAGRETRHKYGATFLATPVLDRSDGMAIVFSINLWRSRTYDGGRWLATCPLVNRLSCKKPSHPGGAMQNYDPLEPPDPEEWQATDEQERIDLVESFHRRARVRLPNAKMHAVLHVMVENQIALGDEIPVKRTVQRLISEGLDRHDAIHAVGSALVGHLSDLLGRADGGVGADSNRPYYTALDQLTAKSWSSSG
jgi:hypothetical protein